MMLAALVLASLPPGYEDEAWCPAGSCLRDVRRPSGTLGPAANGAECFDTVTDVVADEVWTGSRSSTTVPPGYVRVLSNVDSSFATVRCGFEHMHGLPELPTQYETWVTANILNRNYSVVVHEVYDQPGNRALFRSFHADEGDSTSLYLYDLGEYFHINASGCTGGRMSEMRRGASFRAPSGRIVGTHEFFRFATDGQQELYMGVVDVAGVPCDMWRSTIDGGPVGAQMTLDYYFSAPHWRWPSAHASQVPVLLNLTGSRPNGPPGTPRHYYAHTYEFGRFTVGLERYHHGWHANHSFTIPREAGECVGNFTLAAVPYAPPHHHETCDAAPSPSASQEGSVPVSVAVGLCVACLLAGGGIALLLVRLFGGSGRPGTPHVSTLDTQRPVLRAVAIPSSGSMAGGGSDEGSVAGAGCADGIEAAAVQVKTQQA